MSKNSKFSKVETCNEFQAVLFQIVVSCSSISGINDFKKSLGDFLRDKANGDGVLTANDVTTFFANLTEKRKEQQRTTFLPPDNCKF